MISNRKARLLLGVPNIRVGEIAQYRVSNRFWIMVLDNGHRWVAHRKRSARQNREHLRYLADKREAARRAVYDTLLPHVGKPRSALANMDLSALEERLAAAYAPGAAENYALSIGRQIHVDAEKIVSESPDLSITLLDGAGKPVAEFDFESRRFFSQPRTFELARRAIADLNERTEAMLRQVIAERYGDVDLDAFAKDSLRKCWPDREEYFYKNDLLLTVHKPRWDEITFEIHRGQKHDD